MSAETQHSRHPVERDVPWEYQAPVSVDVTTYDDGPERVQITVHPGASVFTFYLTPDATIDLAQALQDAADDCHAHLVANASDVPVSRIKQALAVEYDND